LSMYKTTDTASGDGQDTLQIILYTKPGCHLCDDLLAQLRSMQNELTFDILERNIEHEPDDYAHFRHQIPVLNIPGRDLLCPPHDATIIRQAIDAAINS